MNRYQPFSPPSGALPLSLFRQTSASAYTLGTVIAYPHQVAYPQVAHPLGIVNELGPLPAQLGSEAREKEYVAKISFVRILVPGASAPLAWEAIIQGHQNIRVLHTRLPDQAFRGYLGQTRVEIYEDAMSQIRSAVPEIEYEDEIRFELLITYGDVEQAIRNLRDRINTLDIGSHTPGMPRGIAQNVLGRAHGGIHSTTGMFQTMQENIIHQVIPNNQVGVRMTQVPVASGKSQNAFYVPAQYSHHALLGPVSGMNGMTNIAGDHGVHQQGPSLGFGSLPQIPTRMPVPSSNRGLFGPSYKGIGTSFIARGPIVHSLGLSGISGPTEFHLFGKLLTELRLMVWYYAALQPREVEVRFCKTHASVKWDFTANRPFPILFHVCKESQEVAQKHYTYLFSPYSVGGMPFNPVVDMLYFRAIENNRSFNISPLLKQLQKWVDNFAQKDLIRHVGLNSEVTIFAKYDGIQPFIFGFPNLKSLTLLNLTHQPAERQVHFRPCNCAPMKARSSCFLTSDEYLEHCAAHERRQRAEADLKLLARQGEQFLELLDANQWGPPQFPGKPNVESGAVMHEGYRASGEVGRGFRYRSQWGTGRF